MTLKFFRDELKAEYILLFSTYGILYSLHVFLTILDICGKCT